MILSSYLISLLFRARVWTKPILLFFLLDYLLLQIPLFDHLLLICIRIIPIPPVPLTLVIELHILFTRIIFISGNIPLRPFGPNFPRPFETFLSLMCYGSTILTSALSKLGYNWLFSVAFLIPVIDVLSLVMLYPLMEKNGFLLFTFAIFGHVPRSFFDELWHVLEVVIFFLFRHNYN